VRKTRFKFLLQVAVRIPEGTIRIIAGIEHRRARTRGSRRPVELAVGLNKELAVVLAAALVLLPLPSYWETTRENHLRRPQTKAGENTFVMSIVEEKISRVLEFVEVKKGDIDAF
jgi:hypothetical protein